MSFYLTNIQLSQKIRVRLVVAFNIPTSIWVVSMLKKKNYFSIPSHISCFGPVKDLG